MGEVVPFSALDILAQRTVNLDQEVGDLKHDGGGGTSGSMEERVARLEKNVDQLTKDVGDLRVSAATLTENVRHLPTKPWMFATLAGMLTVLAAVIGAIVRFIPHAS